MDMKKMIQRMTDLENAGKAQLNESETLSECPPMEAPMSAPANPGNPVTMSITLNASGNEHVADLIKLMKNAGLEDAKPAADAIMPMRQDMERLRSIVDEPEMEADAAYGDVIQDDEDLEEWDNEPEAEYQDHKFMTKDLAGGLNREKKAYRAAQRGDNAMAVEEEKPDNYVGAIEFHDGTIIYPKIGDTVELFYSSYTDSDDPADHKPNAVGKIVGKGDREETFIVKWKDHTTGEIEQDEFSAVDEFYILDKDRSDPSRIKGRKQSELPLPGGKTFSRKVGSPKSRTDYAMSLARNMEDMAESIKKELMAALEEKKAKPDFLDMDKDGNKKEPMKKAIADKKKKAPVKEADWNTMAALARLQMQHDAEKKYRDSVRKSDKSKDDLGSLARLGDPETIAGLTRLKMQHDAEKKYRDSVRKKKESSVSEISSKTRQAYNKAANASLDKAQASGDKKTMKKRDRGLDSAYDSKIRSDKKRRETNSKKGDRDYNFGYGESVTNEISSDLAKRYTKAAKMDRDFNDDDIKRLSKSGQSTQDMHRRNAKRTKGINRAAKRM